MPSSIPFSSGGGAWRVDSVVSGTIASGNTGELLSVTPPDGKEIRFKVLVCSSTTTQSGVSVVRDGETVINQLSLSGAIATTAGNRFFIGRHNSNNVSESVRALDEVNAKSSIQINKNAGNTSQQITYAYEIGEYR